MEEIKHGEIEEGREMEKGKQRVCVLLSFPVTPQAHISVQFSSKVYSSDKIVNMNDTHFLPLLVTKSHDPVS